VVSCLLQILHSPAVLLYFNNDEIFEPELHVLTSSPSKPDHNLGEAQLLHYHILNDQLDVVLIFGSTRRLRNWIKWVFIKI
jgi:hypothetical protein